MRQGVEALDLLGSFVRGQPLEGPRRNVLAGGRSAVREAHPLAPQVVVAPEDRNLEHAGALRQNAFHLSGIHVHTTTDDEVLASALQVQEAVVEASKVTHAEGVAVPRCSRLGIVVPIAETRELGV